MSSLPIRGDSSKLNSRLPTCIDVMPSAASCSFLSLSSFSYFSPFSFAFSLSLRRAIMLVSSIAFTSSIPPLYCSSSMNCSKDASRSIELSEGGMFPSKRACSACSLSHWKWRRMKATKPSLPQSGRMSLTELIADITSSVFNLFFGTAGGREEAGVAPADDEEKKAEPAVLSEALSVVVASISSNKRMIYSSGVVSAFSFSNTALDCFSAAARSNMRCNSFGMLSSYAEVACAEASRRCWE
mmetsp:Transcript_5442/g.12305  ORF Transcript_5442/g.12305 Transcript_5442/m.12305 type:complete len:242 (+) Transcript_5442:1682-2407(+)